MQVLTSIVRASCMGSAKLHFGGVDMIPAFFPGFVMFSIFLIFSGWAVLLQHAGPSYVSSQAFPIFPCRLDGRMSSSTLVCCEFRPSPWHVVRLVRAGAGAEPKRTEVQSSLRFVASIPVARYFSRACMVYGLPTAAPVRHRRPRSRVQVPHFSGDWGDTAGSTLVFPCCVFSLPRTSWSVLWSTIFTPFMFGAHHKPYVKDDPLSFTLGGFWEHSGAYRNGMGPEPLRRTRSALFTYSF